jgi:hypothetical protein
MRLHVMGDEEKGKDSGSRQSRGALELSRAMTNINTNHQQDTKHQTQTRQHNMAFTALNAQPRAQQPAPPPQTASAVPVVSVAHPPEIDVAFAGNPELRKRVHAAMGAPRQP